MANTVSTQEEANQKWKNQNGSDYKISALEYPDGLRVKPDLQNYVAFYINTRDKATGGKGNPQNVDFYVSDAEQQKVNKLNTGQNTVSARLSQQDILGAGDVLRNNSGIVVAGLAAAAAIGMGVKAKNVPLTAVAIGAGALSAQYFINKTLSNLPTFASGSTSRLKEVVTLHISEKPVVRYGVNYTSRDLGVLAGLLIQGSAMGSLTAAIESPEVKARLVAELARVPSIKAVGGTISDLLELGTRQKTNPFREVLFESVDYRTFQFTYRFLPKTKSETDKIQKIIKIFKKNMHPDITQNKLFYIYPSEFDIKYYYKNKENDYLHKFARCALVDMVVDYGGDQFVTIGKDGAPAEIGMSLKFQELEQMTSEGVDKNGY
jgi:hypothetical protein